MVLNARSVVLARAREYDTRVFQRYVVYTLDRLSLVSACGVVWCAVKV